MESAIEIFKSNDACKLHIKEVNKSSSTSEVFGVNKKINLENQNGSNKFGIERSFKKFRCSRCSTVHKIYCEESNIVTWKTTLPNAVKENFQTPWIKEFWKLNWW